MEGKANKVVTDTMHLSTYLYSYINRCIERDYGIYHITGQIVYILLTRWLLYQLVGHHKMLLDIDAHFSWTNFHCIVTVSFLYVKPRHFTLVTINIALL